MISNRCPSCHKGHLFVAKSYSKRFMEMRSNCEVCGADFKREPGFYFGAAYVSYALTVALWVAVVVALYTFDALGIITYTFFDYPVLTIAIGVILLFVLLPVLFRLSRSLWIHMFVNRKQNT